MPKLDWILASMLGPSGWRLDVLLVRVTRFARVMLVPIAWSVSPPAPRLDAGPMVIDAEFEVHDDCAAAPTPLEQVA